MNKSYKVVFSKVRAALIVVNEATSSVQAKGTRTVIAAAAAALAMGSAMAQEAPELPENVWSNHTISEDVAVGKGQSFIVDSVTMTGGTLSVSGNVNCQGYDGLFTMTGGTISVAPGGNFEVRDFTMSGGSALEAVGDSLTAGDAHGRTAPAIGSYNSFVMNGGTVNLEDGGRIWIGTAKKNNPNSYQRMQLIAGTINLNGEGFITGNKRFIAADTYYPDDENPVVVAQDTLAYNVIGLDGVTLNVKGAGNVIDAAGTEITAGSVTIEQGGVLTVRATTSTNQADNETLAQMLKGQSYIAVRDAGKLEVNGTLNVNVKELRLQEGGTIQMNAGSWAGWVYASEADAGRGSLVVDGGTLNIDGLAGMDMYDVAINGGVINVRGGEAGEGAGPGNSVRTSPSLGGYNSFVMTGGTVNLDNNGRLWSGKAYGDYQDMVFSGGTVNMIGENGSSYITGTVASDGRGNKLLFSGTTVNVQVDGRIDGRAIEIAGSTFNVAEGGELNFTSTYSTNSDNAGQPYENAAWTMSNGAVNNQGVITSDLAMTVSGGTITTDKLTLAQNFGDVTDADNGTLFVKKAMTLSGGTLAVGTIGAAEGVSGTAVTVNGGTLQTGSGQVFVMAEDAGALFAADQNAAFVTADDEVTGTNNLLTLESGMLALTDTGYYTNASLQAMSSKLAEGMTITILNAQGVLQEGETAMDLVEGVVHSEAGGITGTVTDTTASAGLTTQTAGGTSLEVSYAAADGAAAPTSVALNAQSASTLILSGTADNGALVTLKSDAQDAQPAAAGAVTVGEDVTLQLRNNANPERTSGTIGGGTGSGGSMIVTNIAVDAPSLAVENGTVNIGTNEKRGALSLETLDIASGSTVFLDPAWSGNAELDTVANASHLSVSALGDIAGNLVVGQNSLAAVGATADEAVAAFEKLSSVNAGLSWGENNVSAVLYVGAPIQLAAGGKIVVDGSLAELPADMTGYAEGVTVAGNGLLAVDQAAIGSRTVVDGTLQLQAGSRVGLVNATEGTLTLASNLAADKSVQVVTDNPFITAGALDTASGTVTTSVDAANGLGALASTGLQAMTRRADTVLAQTIADRTSIDQELAAGLNLWVDVAGETYKANDLDNGGEFEADMGYGTFGGDVGFGSFTVGGAFQYGTGSLRSSVSNIKNDIDNYAVSLYGTYKATDALKLAAELAYVWGENDITSSQAALSQSVDTEMYSIGLRAMYEIKAGNFSFVPSVGVRVSQLSTDAMQVGAVKVEDQDQTLVQVPLALRVNASEFDAGGWSVAPSFKIAYVPTFGDKDIEVLSRTQDVIDTSPVQADFGLRVGKDNMLFNVNMLLGAGEYGSSAVGGKVGFKYAF